MQDVVSDQAKETNKKEEKITVLLLGAPKTGKTLFYHKMFDIEKKDYGTTKGVDFRDLVLREDIRKIKEEAKISDEDKEIQFYEVGGEEHYVDLIEGALKNSPQLIILFYKDADSLKRLKEIHKMCVSFFASREEPTPNTLIVFNLFKEGLAEEKGNSEELRQAGLCFAKEECATFFESKLCDIEKKSLLTLMGENLRNRPESELTISDEPSFRAQVRSPLQKKALWVGGATMVDAAAAALFLSGYAVKLLGVSAAVATWAAISLVTLGGIGVITLAGIGLYACFYNKADKVETQPGGEVVPPCTLTVT